jgi:dephospho-CoA kinase
MIRILFLEGPHASGKTTVADAFVKLGWERIKVQRTLKPGEAFQDQEVMLQEYLNHPDKKYVVDRFHLTEFIMTKYTGRDDLETAKTSVRLIHDKILKIHDAAIIVLLPPKEILEERSIKSFKIIDMPVCEAYFEWDMIIKELDVPRFYFTNEEDVEAFAKTVEKVNSNG